MPQVTHMNPDDDFDDDAPDDPTPLEPTDVIGPPPADDREQNEPADRRHDLGGEGG